MRLPVPCVAAGRMAPRRHGYRPRRASDAQHPGGPDRGASRRGLAGRRDGPARARRQRGSGPPVRRAGGRTVRAQHGRDELDPGGPVLLERGRRRAVRGHRLRYAGAAQPTAPCCRSRAASAASHTSGRSGSVEAVYVVALHDRSARATGRGQQHETLLAELRATLESTADGILVTDLAGRIGAYNQRFAVLWGLDAELLTRRDDDALARLDAAQRGRRRRATRERLAAIQQAAHAAGQRRVRASLGTRARTRDAAAAEPRPADRARLLVSRHHRQARREPAHRAALAHRRADRPAEPPAADRPRRVRAVDGAARRHVRSRCCSSTSTASSTSTTASVTSSATAC